MPEQTALDFSISVGSTEPVYRQLEKQLSHKIMSGRLLVGEEIPSVRSLAKALTIHPMTVSKAYGLLESEGWLERRRGKTMVVSARAHFVVTPSHRAELLRPGMERTATEAQQLGLSADSVLQLFESVVTPRLA